MRPIEIKTNLSNVNALKHGKARSGTSSLVLTDEMLAGLTPEENAALQAHVGCEYAHGYNCGNAFEAFTGDETLAELLRLRLELLEERRASNIREDLELTERWHRNLRTDLISVTKRIVQGESMLNELCQPSEAIWARLPAELRVDVRALNERIAQQRVARAIAERESTKALAAATVAERDARLTWQNALWATAPEELRERCAAGYAKSGEVAEMLSLLAAQQLGLEGARLISEEDENWEETKQLSPEEFAWFKAIKSALKIPQQLTDRVTLEPCRCESNGGSLFGAQLYIDLVSYDLYAVEVMPS